MEEEKKKNIERKIKIITLIPYLVFFAVILIGIIDTFVEKNIGKSSTIAETCAIILVFLVFAGPYICSIISFIGVVDCVKNKDTKKRFLILNIISLAFGLIFDYLIYQAIFINGAAV